MKDRVYLSIAGVNADWIVGTIAKDIKRVLEQEGVDCDFGAPEKYNGQEICYHLGYAYAKPFKSARVNSVFITHIDDKIKEMSLARMKDDFDSFICMSVEDESFLIALGIPGKKVFGVALPVRNNYIRPLSLGIFSSYYKDGRKNEEWIVRFCREHQTSQLVNFVFIGPSWGRFLQKLTKLNCSFEWHNVSRSMPYEYEFQQSKLGSLDYYFYLGMDGGAMGTYDAYAYGVKLMVTDNCYHKELPFIEYSFDSYNKFEKSLSTVINSHEERLAFFRENSVERYSQKLLSIWKGNFSSDNTSNDKVVLNKRRENYFPLTIRRVLGYFKRKLY
jgi:hypothetical protein